VVGESPDVWVPAATQPRLWAGLDYTRMSNVDWIRVGGRLREGTSLAEGQAEVAAAFGAIEADWRASANGQGLPAGAQLLVSDGRRGFSTLRSRFERPLQVLGAAVGLLLLVTCVNVASLTTARVASRRREIAIRLAVGARRRDIVRQQLAESLVLAFAGGAAGLLTAVWTTDALLPLLGNHIAAPVLATSVNGRLLIFTVALAAGTGLLFGMLPMATPSSRPSLVTGSARFHPPAIGRALVTAQVAMSLVLLIGAVLFVRTLGNLRTLDAGFDRSHVLMITVNPMASGLPPPALASVNARVKAALAAIPGVESVSQSGLGLMSGRSSVCCISVPGYQPAPGERMAIRTNEVSPEYFATVGMRLVTGRGFTTADGSDRSGTVIVNEAFGRRYFGGASAVGRTFGFGTGPTGQRQIVGVVADARYDGLREPPVPMVFSATNGAGFLQSVALRTTRDPATLAAAARRALAEAEPRLPVREIFTIARLVDASLAQERLMARLAGFLAVLAAVLACVGTYAVLSNSVTARTREIATRIALGAGPAQVRALVLREGATLVLAGLAAGAAAAAAATRVTASLLYGITPGDPIAFLTAVAAMTALTLAAAILPLRRAARVGDALVAHLSA
jgi:predicted permease